MLAPVSLHDVNGSLDFVLPSQYFAISSFITVRCYTQIERGIPMVNRLSASLSVCNDGEIIVIISVVVL